MARTVTVRLVVVALLAGALLAIRAQHRQAAPPWRSPALATTPRGLLLAWLEGTDEGVPVRIRALRPDLSPRDPVRRIARVPPRSELALVPTAAGTQVFARPYREIVLLATVDPQGRRTADPAAGGFALLKAAEAETEGLRLRDHPRRAEPVRTVRARFPSSGDCAWSRPWQALDVRSSDGAATVACVEPAAGGRLWRVRPAGERGQRPDLARLAGAHCPDDAEYGCVAATLDGRDVVAAWVRRTAFELRFEVQRGRGRARTLAREVAVTNIVALGGLAVILGLLLGRALGEIAALRALSAALAGGPGTVTHTGHLRDARFEPVPRGGWRMRLAPASLELDDHGTLALAATQAQVVTRASLRGEVARSSRAVGLFERVHLVVAPVQDGTGAVTVQALSDAPLPDARRAVSARLALAVVEVGALAALAGVTAWNLS